MKKSAASVMAVATKEYGAEWWKTEDDTTEAEEAAFKAEKVVTPPPFVFVSRDRVKEREEAA